jgi:hypothetical protein
VCKSGRKAEIDVECHSFSEIGLFNNSSMGFDIVVNFISANTGRYEYDRRCRLCGDSTFIDTCRSFAIFLCNLT